MSRKSVRFDTHDALFIDCDQCGGDDCDEHWGGEEA